MRRCRLARANRALSALLVAFALCLVVCSQPSSSQKTGGARPWPDQPATQDVSIPRSGGVSSDAQLPSSAFTRTAALDIEDVVFGTDGGGIQRASQCPLDVSLVWSNTLNTGVYATGVLSHLYSDLDSGLQAVIPGFHRELNVLDHDGHHVPGSPINMASEVYFHSSPLLIDFDHDGIKDIVWVNVDGEVFVLNGDPQSDRTVLDYPWKIPKLKVKKNWFAHLDTQVKPPTTSSSSTNPSLTPQQQAAARRLMGVDEPQSSPSPSPTAPASAAAAAFASDPSHPLRIMRREKGRMYLAKRVRHKVAVQSQRQQQRLQRQQQQAPSGRKLLQAKSTKTKPRSKSRGRSSSSRSKKPATTAASAAAAAAAAAAAPSEASKAKAPAAAAAAAASKEDDEEWEEVEEVEEDSDEEDEETGVDEPAPAGGGALGIPASSDSVAAAADAVLESLASKYARSPADAAYAASLKMPASDEGAVDDQEDDEDEVAVQGGARAGWDAEVEMQQQAVDEEAMNRAAAATAARARAGAGAAGSDGKLGSDADLSEYTAPQIRAALDELLKEDPGLGASISELGLEGHDDGAGGTDYADVIKELADKYARQEREVEARQKARQQRTDREDQLAAAEAAAAEAAKEPVPRPTGIASVDAAAAAANAARRRAAAAAAMPDDINSNIVRIMGKPSASGKASGSGGSNAGSSEFSDDLGALLAEQAALDSQLSQLSMDGLPDEAQESLSLFSDDLFPGGGGGSSSTLRGLDPELAWELAELERLYPVREGDDHVWVDAHVLATPVLADLNGDGSAELVFSVSYFFDETDYANRPALGARLGAGIDLRKYVACGLVVADLWSHKILWSEHLDLSTDHTAAKAHMYASPTIADLDGDGSVEIVVPTSMGFVYAFHAHNRQLLRGFPLVLAEVQAQVAVADLDEDGMLEMLIQDARGNVLCARHTGETVWSTTVSGFSTQPASFGDVDGDGSMDVVLATVGGMVYALSGATGKPLRHFPLRTEGRIIAPVTLVNLHPDPSASDMLLAPQYSARLARGLHLVFPSFDGHVYLVEGATGCVNKLDTGEHSYGQVLVADVLGRGKLDLLVTTMSGNVYCFSTESTSHPLRSWSSQGQGLNGFAAREGYHGVYFTAGTKARREVAGKEILVEYVIVDERAKARAGGAVPAAAATGAGEGADAKSKPVPPHYEVSFHMGGRLLATTVHHTPGLYSRSVPAGSTPEYATVEVRMLNEHAQFFSDEFVVGVNVHFYKIIKYLVVLPFLTMAVLMLVINKASYALPV